MEREGEKDRKVRREAEQGRDSRGGRKIKLKLGKIKEWKHSPDALLWTGTCSRRQKQLYFVDSREAYVITLSPSLGS